MAKVLIVLDGGYRFSAAGGVPDFTYTTLFDALVAGGHSVTKAHRQSDTSADKQNFDFSAESLLDYDVIWLIGNQGRNALDASGPGIPSIGDPQLAAIARFMAAGGGVFATGDHDSIGAVMCGRIPRVRAMRCWYGENDNTSPMPANFPRNFPVITAFRADTTQRNPAGDYGGDPTFVWFENQSDSVPQPIEKTTTRAHPILRSNGSDITIYPDHMHEGNTLGAVTVYDYTQSVTFGTETFVEFPAIGGFREMPAVIATGQTTSLASKYVSTGSFVGMNSEASGVKTVNTLSVYDGRVAGVGRIVTGSTFHHYVDINLTGDSGVDTVADKTKAGADAAKGHGFAHPGAEQKFEDIKAVFNNITRWLARPRPAIHLILERSTFSQDEVNATSSFAGAILVTVDGLKPSQFPGGGVTKQSPDATDAEIQSWAPAITPVNVTGLLVVPTAVVSDDPMLLDRLQRFTFTYRVDIDATNAFGFNGRGSTVRVDATLNSPAVSSALTDLAWLQLVKSANPFILDLANNNTTPWLSSDVRVLPVVAGGAPILGDTLAANATRLEVLQFLRERVGAMTVADFENLPHLQEDSALSLFAKTTGSNRDVYNFAIARVRLSLAGAPADDVRVFFRIFVSQTTAALTYLVSSMNVPIEGYNQTGGADPIALPGADSSGNQWLSFPMFSSKREASPDAQLDPDNVRTLNPGTDTFFGALIDSNLDDLYLPETPTSTGGTVRLNDLMMGEHQCIVVQIEFANTPIPNGATPFTSDKLSQRNIAFSAIANPGLGASRVALHTFEIEATPNPITDNQLPDELLLDWRGGAPAGTEVRVFIPTWNADAVVALAERVYPRHEIRAIDAHTVAIPGGGIHYLPIPTCYQRQTGVITAHLPLGVKKGQRFDLAVRQVTTRSRHVKIEQPRVTRISLEEAAGLAKELGLEGASTTHSDSKAPVVKRGVFNVGRDKTLVTDLRVFDAAGDYALIIEHPDPAKVAKTLREAGRWRETIGAFQLGIPVSIKAEMLAHHLRLLSLFRWRAEHLRRDSRWYRTILRYVELLADKVRALGGDPCAVPATPDGNLADIQEGSGANEKRTS